MIKVIPNQAWDNFPETPIVETVKYSSRGLIGEDLSRFVKRASHPLIQWVKDNPPQPGEVYLHVINMGSTEKVGPNRNGDGYSEQMLARDYITFEKYARWYYNHKNNDPSKSYGLVKKAIFLPDLGRVDSIVAINASPQAARRNGGLVDNKTLQRLESGRLVAVSQSCNVPYDVCVSCGNVARSRAEYCGPEMCKYGGCRDNLGKVFDDGFHLYVDNPRCTFFDLSDVSDTRGADRTAFITGKVASVGKTISGAELAELLNLSPPSYLISDEILPILYVAHDLHKRACACQKFMPPPPPSWDDCVAVRKQIAIISLPTCEIADVPETVPSPSLAHQILSELGGSGVILPPSRWLSLLTGVSPHECAPLFSGGLDVEKDLLISPERDELIQDAVVPANYRVQKWIWLAPSNKAHRLESANSSTDSNKWRARYFTVKLSSENKALSSQVKSRYLAYQLRVLHHHKDSPLYDVLLDECIRHNLGITV